MRMRFNRYFHLGARFQAYLFPLFVDERIFDSDFPIKVIRSFDSDLGFFGIAWHYRLDDFFDCGWQGGSSFFAHGVQFSRIVASSAPKTTAPFQPNLSDIPDAPARPSYANLNSVMRKQDAAQVFAVSLFRLVRSGTASGESRILYPLKQRQRLSSAWCPKSVPKCGSDFVPVIFTGISVPAPSLLKNGSAGFSKIDFQPVTICESFASIFALP
jgi:hypothetical protein